MLAIIPARSGSKGLRNKNILNLKKLPLIAHTIQAAKKSKKISKVVVITDSKKISKIAKKYGAEVPFIRPKKLSTDTSKVIDTYFYTLKFFKKKNLIYKEFIALLPTSPLRDHKDIDAAIDIFKKNNAKSVISVTKQKKPIEWNLLIDKKKKIVPFFKPTLKNRQAFRETFIPNGAIYIFDVMNLKKTSKYYSDRTFAYVMPDFKSIDIDEKLDLEICNLLFKKKDK